ncbi:MAG: sigma-70 family RNA polymerase sigma factor [Planctomycetes bacterium]|nr:sigma-70 family RNA polymerase sigma factor [Planctomycetota bacterium]
MTDIQNLTDARLLELFAKKKDSDAFRTIFNRHYRFVWSVCRRRLSGREHLVEDAVQTVFLALFHYAGRIRNACALSAWLYQTAGFVSIKIIRVEASRREREKKAAIMMKDMAGEPVLEAGWGEVRGHLDEAVGRLPGKQRDAVVMHFLAGKSLGEISAETGIGKATVQKRVETGIEKLRSILSARNIAVSVAGLGTMIAGNSLEAAPAGLAQTVFAAITHNISAGGSAAGGMVNVVVKGIGKMMLMAKLKVAAAIVFAAAAVSGTGAAILVAQGGKTPTETVVQTTAPVTAVPATPGDATVVEITDKVLVKDCVPFGVNLSYGNDSPEASPWLKDRIRASFEGSTYRQCLLGVVQDETGVTLWVGPSPEWQKIHLGAKFTILNGPAKGMTGTIKEITTKKVVIDGKEKEYPYYVFDKTVPAPPLDKSGLPDPQVGPPGVMVEKLLFDEGYIGESSNYFLPNAGMKDKFPQGPREDVLIGDVRPGSTGRAVCHLIAPETGNKAFIRFDTIAQHLGQTNGTWKVSFWAKAKAGTPAMEVLAVKDMRGTVSPAQKITLEKDWKKYDLTFDVAGIPEPADWKDPKKSSNGRLYFLWEVGGGEALLDEVSAQMADEQNPTVFRDDLIATLKRLNVGSVRSNQQGGNTIDNIFTPGFLNHCGTSSRSAILLGPYGNVKRLPFSVSEMYTLCEQIGSDPWYCLPGTLHKEEMSKFMEFIGAPADTGLGKLRAQLGHPKPWTESLRFIHVEIGNEAWNSAPPYHSSGFWGSDYWRELIETAKKSPYYRPNVLFHVGGPVSPTKNTLILQYTPNGDRLSIAPYLLDDDYRKEDMAFLDTQDKFYRWLLAWPIFRSRDPRGKTYKNYQLAKKANMELSIYEINYGVYADKNSPWMEEPRKRMFTTLGGGIGLINNLLVMLKEQGIRTQNVFPLASGSDGGLWDFVLSMRKGHERYRPNFLGLSTVNQAIGGDLVETIHAGADPKWGGEGLFYIEWKKEPQCIKYENIPCIMSYAFRNKNKRGLILVNLDLAQNLPVQLRFPGEAKGGKAVSRLLTADKITASNEWEVGEPQVSIKEETITDFSSGRKIVVPPFSMISLTWEDK